MLEQCDRDQVYCYLETQNEANARYYQEFEFQIVETVLIPNTAVQLWCMLRSPNTLS